MDVPLLLELRVALLLALIARRREPYRYQDAGPELITAGGGSLVSVKRF